jgi:DNA-binding response OmpR family regulator
VWSCDMRVLVAEDDVALRSVLERGLKENGYVVDTVEDGDAALRFLRSYEYAVVILDWRMPRRDGLEVTESARRAGIRVPILMLTARDTPKDRISGLTSGADDYLVKPFDFGELLARLLALQRRPALRVEPVLRCGDLVLDPAQRELKKDGEDVSLTATEFSLIELLMRRSPSIITRRTIAHQVWTDEADAVGSNTIDVHVARLRSKLQGAQAHIETVRGAGYRLVES